LHGAVVTRNHTGSMTVKKMRLSVFSLAAFATVFVSLGIRIPADGHFAALTRTPLVAANALSSSRTLYAVNQSLATRGSISVYDIDRGHNLLKTIPTVSNVDDVKGVAVSAATGKLYVAYRTRSAGMIYCLDIYEDAVLWNRVIDADVDRLSMDPNGRLLKIF
jgi:DNA-binding beta-propeller fold protein YncE